LTGGTPGVVAAREPWVPCPRVGLTYAVGNDGVAGALRADTRQRWI